MVAKSLASKYTPGARGRGWLKIKHARTLDLVIVAADWGYGRRNGWLSNYHLAARDEASGGFAEVGKTFKGLTDAQFEAMTERLLALKIERRARHGDRAARGRGRGRLQRHPAQPAVCERDGAALRAHRRDSDDKQAEEADTLAAMAAAFERQLVRPA